MHTKQDMSRTLRKIESSEADTLKCIMDYLDLLQAQGKLVYIRHNPSTVISKVVRGKIKTAFKKVRPSQLGAPDLIVLKGKGSMVGSLWVTDVLLIEAKSPTGKLSTAQDRWAKLAVAQGMRYVVARDLEDVQEALG